LPLFLLLPTLITCMAIPFLKDCKFILYGNLFLIFLYVLTMIYNDIAMGSMVYIIAFCGTLSQILLTNSNIKIIRVTLACLFAVTGSFILYSHPIDLIVISAFLISRMAEISNTKRTLLMGYFVSISLNMVYSYINGIYDLSAIQMIFLLSIILSHFRVDIFTLRKFSLSNHNITKARLV